MGWAEVGRKEKPWVISLENVKQILQWGPLIAKRDRSTGRVVKLDGSVAAPGEHVPVQQQFLIPDPKRRGQTWRRFVHLLEGMGYQVEWRVIKACDFGAPTSRERLFMIARSDGHPIVWPEPTHAKHPKKGSRSGRPQPTASTGRTPARVSSAARRPWPTPRCAGWLRA